MKKQYRALRAPILPSDIRVETFEDREHIVVPIIAMVGNSIIQAIGSIGPELVPTQELEKFPGGWNDRRLTSDHPREGSVGSPEIIERQAIGLVFNSKIENGNLKIEGWVDVEKSESLGGEALETLNRLRALKDGTSNEIVEISIGASISLDPTPGIVDGKRFAGRWQDIVPDHVALLPRGEIGACSVAMGAGTRAAKTIPDTLACIRKIVQALSDKGLSDGDIRNKIFIQVAKIPLLNFGEGFDTLSTEFWGVEQVFQESSTAISVLWDDGRVRLFRHKFTINDGNITLSGKPEEVIDTSEQKFETLESVPKPETLAAAPNVSTNLRTGECNMCERQKMVARLLELKAFGPEDEQTLMTMSEPTLKSILESHEKLEKIENNDDINDINDDDRVEAALSADTAEPDQQSAERAELLTQLVSVPADEWDRMQQASNAYFDQQSVERAELLTQLSGKIDITEKDLGDLPNNSLRKLASAVGRLTAAEEKVPTEKKNFTFIEPRRLESSGSRKAVLAPRSHDNSEVN